MSCAPYHHIGESETGRLACSGARIWATGLTKCAPGYGEAATATCDAVTHLP